MLQPLRMLEIQLSGRMFELHTRLLQVGLHLLFLELLTDFPQQYMSDLPERI